ncbi:hypothetical protein [aff. Roholtiella sp. LEGE 12411]
MSKLSILMNTTIYRCNAWALGIGHWALGMGDGGWGQDKGVTF